MAQVGTGIDHDKTAAIVAYPDDHFLLLFNGHHEPVLFTIPDGIDATAWTMVIDTSGSVAEPGVPWETGSSHEVPGRTVIVLQATPQPGLLQT